MAPPTETVLEFLTHPNPKVQQWKGTGGSNTTHERWDPIEGIQPLEGFTFNNCYQTYKTDLKKAITPIDLCKLVPRAHLNRIMNEDTIVSLATLCNILPVNLALEKANKDLHIAPGSMFFMNYEDGKPDWGVGDDQLNANNQGLLNHCPGDSKLSSKWTIEGLLDPNLDLTNPGAQLRNQLRPLEQIQHYSRGLKTPWGWIMTEKGVTITRVTNSAATHQSPRPSRGVGHQRVVSNTSTLSSDMSSMSIDGSSYSTNSLGSSPGPIEVVFIPWSAEGDKKMTVNLALYYVARLALQGDEISDLYPPLDPKAIESAPSKGLAAAVPKASQSKASSSKPKATGKDVLKKIFVSGQGIHLQVIFEDITIYIPDAEVEEGEHAGVNGYFIRYLDPKNAPFPEFLKFLRRDTEAWLQEDVTEYPGSATHKRRDDLRTNEL